MHTLSAVELLATWEMGSGQAPAQRAITVLAPACNDLPEEELARLPIGQRDAGLLDCRERLFGSRVSARSCCPVCAEVLELAFDISDVRVAPAPAADQHALSINYAGISVDFRLPNSADLGALLPASGPVLRRQLFERCVLRAHDASGQTLAPAELPEEVVDRAAARMAEADPQADVQLVCRCPRCTQEWSAPFDIAGYLWIELGNCAQHLLREVHEIASAYGWRETDILGLSAVRRQHYLEMIRQ